MTTPASVPAPIILLHIHDTLETFGARIGDLPAEWAYIIKPRLHATSVRSVQHARGNLFGGMSDSIREASRMASVRTLSPEMIREVCSFGFAQIFLASD